MTSKLTNTGLVLAALIAAPVATNAADLRAPASSAPTYKAPVYVAHAPSWTGFYVGLNAGYGFGDANWSGAFDPSPSGFLVGATLGYNVQTGSWVWGIEADIAWSNMDDTVGGRTTEMPWFGTARGRIGYAGWGSSMMPYITAGAAFASVDNSRPTGSASDTLFGWTAGLGVEYLMWSNWSVKLEYLYADLGAASGPAATTIDVTANIVRAGVNYRF